jgi:NTP pyrophosphatase (non-canonical NTP hydrolase)
MTNRPYDGISIDNFADWVEAGWTRKADTAPDQVRELSVAALGLSGEVDDVIAEIRKSTGGVTELIKKEIRGDGPLDRNKLTLELGDVQHYLCRLARMYDISMNEVLVQNIEKIEARRGKRAWEQKNAVHS